MADRRDPSPTLIGAIYEASLDPALWAPAIAALRVELDGALSAMFFRDQALSGTDFSLLGTSGYPDSALAAYGTYYVTRDIRWPTISRLKPQDVYIDDGQMPFDSVRRSEIFNDYFRLVDGGYAVGANLFQDASRFCVLSVHRSIASGGFDESYSERFRRVTPHFIRALQMHRQFARAKSVSNALGAALDHFAMAVLLVDANGKIIFLNAFAELLLNQPGCPLKVESLRLHANSSSATAILRQDIKTVIDLARGKPITPPQIRSLSRVADEGAPIWLMIAPARHPERFGLSVYEPLAIIFVADPSISLPNEPEAMIKQFGLTTAEAQVVVKLMSGNNLDKIAEHRRVSRETVRVQIRSILDKTDTRSQSQLIALLSRSLASLKRSAR